MPRDTHDTYEVTTEPTEEPLSLADLKCRMRVTSGQFNEEIRDLLTAARKQVEYDTNRRLITQTVKLYLERFPSGNTLEIRTAPVSSVTSVTYVDEATTTQTMSAALYVTDLTGLPPRIILAENQDWPDTEANYPRAVTVEMVCGYGDASTVPVEAILAITEWCKMNWGDCDGDDMKYRNLINRLAWTGIGRAA